MSDFVILDGQGRPTTRLVLKDQNGTHEYYGPVFSSRPRRSECGTPQWIDQIFLSTDPTPSVAYAAAMEAAKKALGTDKPWHTLDSSLCGLSATLHVVGAAQPVKIDVTRMISNADDPIEGRPSILAVSAWVDRNQMTDFEVADFNQTAKMVCRATGILGKLQPDPKLLKKSRRKS